MRNIKYILLACIVVLITCCKKETTEVSKPWINKGEYNPETGIAISKMTGGDEYITERGHAWGLNPEPTPEDSSFKAYENAENTVDTVTIITEITDLMPDSIYYFRAYAIDKFDNVFLGEDDIIFNPNTSTSACFSISNDECEISECFINFDATCSENAIQYRWDFDGDGIFELVGDDKQAVSYEYTEPGSYEVKLQTVSPSGIVDDMVKTVQTFAVGGALVPCFTTNTTEAELDEIVYFDAFCSENAVDFQWDLDGDSVFEINGEDKQLVNQSYADTGVYNVTLRVVNVDGIFETTTTPITVLEAVSINPTACFTIAEVDKTIYFDASCSLHAVNYDWDLDGDGVFEINGTDYLVNHTYTTVGTYNATLRVRNIHDVSDTMVMPIEIDESNSVAPYACFLTNVTSAEVEQTIIFDASCSENAVTYNWDFDGDNIFDLSVDNQAIANYSYPLAGTYLAKLVVENANGITHDTMMTINITEPEDIIPYACFEIINTSEIETGQPVYFDASCSQDAISYRWDFGDGTILDGNQWEAASHTYDDSDSYMVILTVESSDGTTAQDTVTVTVNEPPPITPTACIVADVSTTVEIGETIYFDASCSQDAVNYRWDFDDGTILNGSQWEVASHAYDEPGPYTVILTVESSDGTTAQDTITITVNEPTPITPTACIGSGVPTTVEIGETVYFNASCSQYAINYRWDFGDGTILNGSQWEVASHTYDEPDDYMIILTVESNDGTTAQDTVTITVNEPTSITPIACIASDVPTTVETGETIYFDASCSQDAVNYKWDFGDGTILNGSQWEVASHAYDAPGPYRVTLTVRSIDGTEANLMTSEIQCNAPPPETVTIYPPDIEDICPRLINGDADLGGEPHITINCQAVFNDYELYIHVYFNLAQIAGDYTEGEYDEYIKIYDIPNGKNINEIVSDEYSSTFYIDTDHDADIIPGTEEAVIDGTLVDRFSVLANTDNIDLPDIDETCDLFGWSELDIYFNPITIELVDE